MSLFDRIEQRESSFHPRDPALAELFGYGNRSSAGVSVTAERSLTIPAFWSGVRLICETLAALPLVLIRAHGKTTERAKSHPLYRVLHEEPNEWQTSMEWREMCQAHILLRGVSYNAITETRGGNIEQLVPLHPDRVTPRFEPLRPGGPNVRYWRYQPLQGDAKIFLRGDLFIVPGMSIFDMLRALDPMKSAQDSLGLAIAAELHGAAHFSNGVQPSGILEHPGKLKDDAHKKLKADFDANRAGAANAGKTLILEEGMKWHQIGLTNKDAQFLESRKFQVVEIARILRVPPHLIYDLERATFSNIEHQGIEFVKYTMLPWFVRWEQRISKHLLGPTERLTIAPKFIAEGLQRGDQQSRYSAYAVGRQWGWLSANDVLELEDRNPIGPEGDTYLSPMNMIPADQAANPQEEPDDEPEPDAEEQARTALRSRLERAHVRLFLDAAQRILRKEVESAKRAIAKARAQSSVDPLTKWRDDFFADHGQLVSRTLQPAIHCTAEALASAVLFPATPAARALNDMADSLAGAAARRHVSQRRSEVSECLTGTAEQAATRLESLLIRWESAIPDLAGAEVEAVGASVTHAGLLPAPPKAA